MTRTALAAIFDGPGQPFRLEALPLPDSLAAGQALVEVELATICGSDLHTVQGRRRTPSPIVLGHEGVGRVVASSPERDTLLGRRVTWTLTDSCGACPPCTAHALPQKCRSVTKYGHAPLTSAPGLNGTYASHLLIRPGTHLIPVPGDLSTDVIAPANCALATMVAVTEALPPDTRTVVIQGAGLLGIYGCALLRDAGVPHVLVVDENPARLAVVSAFGGQPILGSALPAIGPEGADAVIEVAGSARVVPDGLAVLRPGGSYLFAGLVHPDSTLPLTGEMIIRRCLTLRGFHNYAPRHLETAVQFLARRQDLPWAALIAPAKPLSEIGGAFDRAASGRWHRAAITPNS